MSPSCASCRGFRCREFRRPYDGSRTRSPLDSTLLSLPHSRIVTNHPGQQTMDFEKDAVEPEEKKRSKRMLNGTLQGSPGERYTVARLEYGSRRRTTKRKVNC